jgi:hypothetical protein
LLVLDLVEILVLGLVEAIEVDSFVLELVGATDVDFLLEAVETVDLILELGPVDDDGLFDEVDDFTELDELLVTVVYGGRVTLELKS